MTSSLRIIVTGMIAHYPVGGIAWHYLQYVLGLARLGHDVYYFEDVGVVPCTPADNWSLDDCSYNVQYLSTIMSHFGLQDKWAYCFYYGPQWFGLADEKRREVIQSADLLINVSGSRAHPEHYRQIPRLAFVDTDPVFNQIGLTGRDEYSLNLALHDVHFSFGERLSDVLLATGYCWHPTRQPVVLSEWHPQAPKRNCFTTVMTWMARSNALLHAGQAYGQKDVEIMRFLDLPSKVKPAMLELALNSGIGQAAPCQLLLEKGWHVVDPQVVCPDFDSYRTYIESSMAEWSVAKHGYVQGQSGWFSERSACYLAAGRPVVVQDTGFSDVLPVGEGILPFTTMDEAAAAIEQIGANYDFHAKAARAIAEEYFASDKILSRLIEDAFSKDV